MLVSSLFPICFYSVSFGFLCSYVPLLMRLQCLSCKALRVHFPCNVSAMFVHYVSVRFPRSLFIFLGARRIPKSPLGDLRACSLPNPFRFPSEESGTFSQKNYAARRHNSSWGVRNIRMSPSPCEGPEPCLVAALPCGHRCSHAHVP